MDGPLDAFFRRLERRDDISADERQALVDACGPQVVVERGMDIVREHDRATRSTLVVDGYTIRYRTLADGQRQITALHVPGDFVDLPSLVLKIMDHSVAALSTCTIVTFDHDKLRRITERFPHLTRVLWLVTLLDSAIQREWIVGMGRRTAKAHMAHFICELRVRLEVAGRMDGDNSFMLPITQMELGDALGFSSVHVNRVLQELRAESLLSWQGERVTILDWERLQEVAQFDTNYLHLVREPR